jgi:hypothetical protein
MAMGLLDRLRAILGGSEPDRPNESKVQEELAVERVQDDIEHDRDDVRERRIETPTSLED